jgi:hypothetical protein
MSALISSSQFASRGIRQWALACVLLALLMVGVEATHVHPDAASARTSSLCAICISVHANAPAVAFHPLPALTAVETVAIAFQTEGKSILKEITLFIRPPPERQLIPFKLQKS